jgi:purine-binding chemotaxis protein CheW
MVDLAKIRKKAKKALGEESPSRQVAESPSEPAPQAPPAPDRPLGDSETRRPGDSKLDRFKAEAGKLREQKIEAQAEQPTEGQLELLTFTISGEHYAVDIERIVEIVTPRPVTRIPNAASSIVGIISLRGTIVTLVDVRRKLRHPDAELTADTRIVVIDFRNENVGFVVDRVLRVVKLARNAVEPHPVVHSTELEESIRGVFRAGGALTILLDLDKLLDHSQWT